MRDRAAPAAPGNAVPGTETGDRLTAGGAPFGAFASSACCLLALGLGGGRTVVPTALVPYQPLFPVPIPGLLPCGHRRRYGSVAGACTSGGACAALRSPRPVALFLRLATVLAAVVLLRLVPPVSG